VSETEGVAIWHVTWPRHYL